MTRDRTREFEMIFARHVEAVRRFTHSRLDRQSAEDVTAETFLAAWRDLDRLPPEPLAWLLRVARNKIVDQYRAGGRGADIARDLAESVPFRGRASLDNPTAAYLATLPTTTEAMTSFLQTHATGATSRDEAVFFAVQSIIGSDLAPLDVRVAALHALALIGHITVDPSAHDSLGRRAVRVDFVDQAHRPGEVQTDFFDPTSAQILQDQLAQDGRLVYRSVTTISSVVDTVPALRCE